MDYSRDLNDDTHARALELLEALPPGRRLEEAALRLVGLEGGLLGDFSVGVETSPRAGRLDGRLLELLAARALAGARGSIFTGSPEAGVLAALGLARVAARRGAREQEALSALLGVPFRAGVTTPLAEARAAASPSLGVAAALSGVRVLDPCCGGGALLVAALIACRRVGVEPVLLGLELAPLAASACRARLRLLGAAPVIACADAVEGPWPGADLVLANPPFLRHEALSPEVKKAAVARTGLGRRADLSAHFALLALRHASEVALVWPRGLEGARSAAPLRAEAAARGGFTYRLRSGAAGSFAASIDTSLAVWSEGVDPRPAFEADVPLGELAPEEVASLGQGLAGARLRARAAPRPPPSGAARLDELCAVRFGMKSGCNAFFHLRRIGESRFESALAGEVELPDEVSRPILASLKEVSAPGVASPRWQLFRPSAPDLLSGPGERTVFFDARVEAYLARGEELGVAQRPTCRGRTPWWLVAPGRAPAPLLYPAKVGARAFAFENAGGLWEDKKWHALFPRHGLPPWLLAAALSATPVRLGVEEGARQLTGAQAIADIDCHVLAAVGFPEERALRAREARLAACWAALAKDPVTTDLAAALARPAQLELDHLVGEALGSTPAEVEEARRALLQRVSARLELAAQVRNALTASGRR